MACPYLQEGRAWYCHAAPFRKLILDGPGMTDAGRCASPNYRQCELVDRDATPHNRCPLLEQVRVQYCSASPVTKLVPFSDSRFSCCTGAGYRYCDSYLGVARPDSTTPPTPVVFYSPNHLWLGPEESGYCHIGVDPFLTEVAGGIDAITFVTLHGTACPALVLTIHGVEWPMRFPNLLMVQKVNGRVRSDPARLTADPYGAGWLFEGWELPGQTRSALISGMQAAAWQAEEREQLTRLLHEMGGAACDGGNPMPGVAGMLPREQMVRLLQHFFARRGWAVEE